MDAFYTCASEGYRVAQRFGCLRCPGVFPVLFERSERVVAIYTLPNARRCIWFSWFAFLANSQLGFERILHLNILGRLLMRDSAWPPAMCVWLYMHFVGEGEFPVEGALAFPRGICRGRRID